jgi:hypothetical protein
MTWGTVAPGEKPALAHSGTGPTSTSLWHGNAIGLVHAANTEPPSRRPHRAFIVLPTRVLRNGIAMPDSVPLPACAGQPPPIRYEAIVPAGIGAARSHLGGWLVAEGRCLSGRPGTEMALHRATHTDPG